MAEQKFTPVSEVYAATKAACIQLLDGIRREIDRCDLPDDDGITWAEQVMARMMQYLRP